MKLNLAATAVAMALATQNLAFAQTEPPKEAPAQNRIVLSPELMNLLREKVNLAELTEAQLKDRIAKSEAALADPALPPQLKERIAAIAKQSKEELANRAAAAAEAKAKAAAEAKAAADAQQAAETKAKADAEAKAKAAVEAKAAAEAKALADAKAAAEAKQAAEAKAKADAEAKARADAKAAEDAKQAADAKAKAEAAAKAANDAKLAAEAKAATEAKAKAKADAETKARADAKAAADAKAKADADSKAALDAKQATDAKAAEDTKQAADAKAKADAAAATKAANDAKLAAEAKAAADAKAKADADAKARADAKAAADAQATANARQAAVPPPPPPPKIVERPVAVAPAAPPAVQPPPPPEKVQAVAPISINAAAEAKALAYAKDATDIARLSDDDLRKRLDEVRELLAANQLSEPVQRAAREKLLVEREALRQRLAAAEAKRQQAAAAPPPPPPAAVKAPAPPAAPPPTANNSGLNFSFSVGVITQATPPRQVLEDRRPADQLRAEELMRRLQVYGDAQRDNQYDQGLRNYWRGQMAYDRELLRLRLAQERKNRMARRDQDAEIDFTPPPKPLPRNIFAAEVGRDTLFAALTAPPPPGFDRRVDIGTFVRDPAYRARVPRVEVDTVHFGYNEGFLREEELANLDAIARMIERIVRFRPNEVFLIEGHTDARGSDAYNLKLSRLRAASVKAMLVKYYAIAPNNLKDVGVGDHYPKIPTLEAEPENRRVTIVRATPYLAGLR